MFFSEEGKTVEEINTHYLSEWENDRWWPAIKHVHETISNVFPEYKILQIKSKFGGLRYYWTSEPNNVKQLRNEQYEKNMRVCKDVVAWAEAWCSGYEAAIRDFNIDVTTKFTDKYS